MWRKHYNQVRRPHSSLGCRPPAPEAIAAGPTVAQLKSDLQREQTSVNLPSRDVV